MIFHKIYFNIMVILVTCFFYVFDVELVEAKSYDMRMVLLGYSDDVCKVIFWSNENGERVKRLYSAKSYVASEDDEISCSVKIPIEEFERELGYCALSGLANLSNTSTEFSVMFFGGRDHPNKYYYFEWRDAKYVKPTYMCFR